MVAKKLNERRAWRSARRAAITMCLSAAMSSLTACCFELPSRPVNDFTMLVAVNGDPPIEPLFQSVSETDVAELGAINAAIIARCGERPWVIAFPQTSLILAYRWDPIAGGTEAQSIWLWRNWRSAEDVEDFGPGVWATFVDADRLRVFGEDGGSMVMRVHDPAVRFGVGPEVRRLEVVDDDSWVGLLESGELVWRHVGDADGCAEECEERILVERCREFTLLDDGRIVLTDAGDGEVRIVEMATDRTVARVRGSLWWPIAGVGMAAVVEEPGACVQVRVEDGDIVVQTVDSHIPPLYHSDYAWRTMRRGIVAPPWWLIPSDEHVAKDPEGAAWMLRVHPVTLAKDRPLR